MEDSAPIRRETGANQRGGSSFGGARRSAKLADLSPPPSGLGLGSRAPYPHRNSIPKYEGRFASSPSAVSSGMEDAASGGQRDGRLEALKASPALPCIQGLTYVKGSGYPKGCF